MSHPACAEELVYIYITNIYIKCSNNYLLLSMVATFATNVRKSQLKYNSYQNGISHRFMYSSQQIKVRHYRGGSSFPCKIMMQENNVANWRYLNGFVSPCCWSQLSQFPVLSEQNNMERWEWLKKRSCSDFFLRRKKGKNTPFNP